MTFGHETFLIFKLQHYFGYIYKLVVHHFGFVQNTLTTIGWIAVEYDTHL